jgi:choline dehydrogenase-like flavoprotein
MAEHYDAIVIGTGAGGGTLALHLAQAGKKLLILERGPFLPQEKLNWDTSAVFLRNRYHTREIWHDKDGKPLHPQQAYFVGGQTKVYGAAMFRLRAEDFGVLHHKGGISPAWPITYADLEPYYTKAEALFHVHGDLGTAPAVPGGYGSSFDPTEPFHSKPYPYPAFSHEPRMQEIEQDVRALGIRTFPIPLGLKRNETDPVASKCVRCDTCDGYPCLVHAKADAEVVAVRPALRHSNVTLITNAEVTQLKTSPSGREVTEVVVSRNGKLESYRGGIVVVSAGAANSARILLLSANDKHPNGLANGSDQVGRNYMFHNSQAVVALSLEPNLTQFQKTISLNDFYFRDKDFDFPMGNIQMIGKSKGPMFRDDAPFFAPGFALDEMARHAVDFWLTTEDLPDPNNRVTLDRDKKIVLHYTFNNHEPTKRLYARLKSMLEMLGLHKHLIPNSAYLGKEIPIAGVGHQSGTCRFGSDPKTSVLDVNCKAHELDNLYVVDTSFFCSIGAVNPSLTAIANALRVGDHLLERLK